jgi:hypothetical protein
MRKFLTVAVIALTAALGSGAADAQVRIRAVINPGVMMQKGPRVHPRINPVRPKLLILPPSAAIGRAVNMMPGSKAIGVKLRGQTYVVRLKSGGTIARVGVDSVTGAASLLP